jgi:DNA-binding transcriptional MerR regulator
LAKSADAFRTISEAAEEVGAPQHVLRFWETKFSFVTPVKRAGGRRFYRPQDIAVLKAVRRLHKEQGLKTLVGADMAGLMEARDAESPAEPLISRTPALTGVTDRLNVVLMDLEQAKARLDAVLRS